MIAYDFSEKLSDFYRNFSDFFGKLNDFSWKPLTSEKTLPLLGAFRCVCACAPNVTHRMVWRKHPNVWHSMVWHTSNTETLRIEGFGP